MVVLIAPSTFDDAAACSSSSFVEDGEGDPSCPAAAVVWKACGIEIQ